MMTPTNIIILIAIGLTAGVLSGIFGIGGGVLIVPAFIYLLNYSPHKAIGTSLAVLLPPIGIAAVLEYYRHGNVDLPAALTVAVTALLGAWLGAVISNKLPGPALRLAFGIFVVSMGVYIIVGAVKKLGI